jgi:hypothetical protein
VVRAHGGGTDDVQAELVGSPCELERPHARIVP